MEDKPNHILLASGGGSSLAGMAIPNGGCGGGLAGCGFAVPYPPAVESDSDRQLLIDILAELKAIHATLKGRQGE